MGRCDLASPALVAVVVLVIAACGGDPESGSGTAGSSGGSNDAGAGTVGDGEDDTGLRFNFDTSGGGGDDTIEPGTFGAPCKTNSECDSTLCIQTADGQVCSRTCIEDCPSGFECLENKVAGGDTVFMCLPRWLRLCDPCNENKECNAEGKSGNVCVSFGKNGSYCGVKCEFDKECPTGYECSSVTDASTGTKSKQCAVTAGLCSCSKRAEDLGLTTKCQNSFQGAVCDGIRKCRPGGLSDCSAEVPKPEECNGIDDDCDGKTDNFDGGGGKCKGKKNDFGQCEGVITACNNGKVTCDAPAAQPEKCNGKDDDCDGDTDEGLCDDGKPCTQDLCNTDGSCKHTKVAGMKCDDGNICTQTDKCKAGKCVGGNTLDCDDQDACSSDSCDKLTGCKHKPNSAASCKDDGNVCTQDVCQAGSCVHPPVKEGSPCPDDGQACTQDICNNKICLHQPKDGKKCVSDGNPCTADVCHNGKCAHKPSNGGKCLDDGKPCTLDVCELGKCIHKQSSGGKCEDGNPCTLNDKCLGGNCLAGTFKSCNDGNPCTKDACDPKKGCQHANNDYAPCQAKSGTCPTGICWGGGCQSKPNEPCSTKVKVGLCSSVPVTGKCSASGKCSPTSSPKQVTCTINCQGFCINCLGIQLCIPINY